MTHQEFLDKRLGGRYRETVQLGYQCIALIKLYSSQRWWKQVGYFWGIGAYQGWINNNNTFDQNFYDKIPNTIKAIPQQGDIIIFKANKNNEYHWHIAIVHSANINTIEVVEQNGGTGNWNWLGTNAIRIQKYNYWNVVGWYHYKQSDAPLIPPPKKDTSPIDEDIQLLINDNIWNWVEWEWMTNRIWKVIAKMYKKIKQ